MKAISFMPLRNVPLLEKLYFPPTKRWGYKKNGQVFSILREFIYIVVLKMRQCKSNTFQIETSQRS